MSTVVPRVPGGLTATIWASLLTVKLAAGTRPNMTDVAKLRPLPVIVTDVPPAGAPLVGLMEVTAGRGATKVYTSADDVALVPPADVTVTSTDEAASAGLTATICVSVFDVTLAAGTEPNLTEVAKSSPVPVIVTEVPPLVGPLVGLMPLTTGVGAT